MIQFKPYKIFVVYSEHSQLSTDYETTQLNRAGNYEQEKLVNNASLLKTDSNPLWKEDVIRYENTVLKMLEKIHRTPIGKMFFGILNPKADIWIVPKHANNVREKYSAMTHPLNYTTKPFNGYDFGYGDTYIWFTPNEALTDDTLFHEFIHAYRIGYNKFERFTMSNDTLNTEEFLAWLITNIYQSGCGKSQLNFKYGSGELAFKDKIYESFIEDPESIMVLKHFLDHEYLAMLLANFPHAEFNPFRDYSMLEKKTFEWMNEGKDPTKPELFIQPPFLKYPY
jgi:hypothetical protein